MNKSVFQFSKAFGATLSDSLFQKFAGYIETQSGILMPPDKKVMLESRLRKRLRELGMNSFEQYSDHVFSEAGMQSEIINLIDVVTTNKTEFFREAMHFKVLTETVLPELKRKMLERTGSPLRIWSAGCSTGEEPYTLAMVLNEFAESHPGFDFTILATDLSTQVLEKAKSGIYDEDKIQEVPHRFKEKYLSKSKDRSKHLVRVVSSLRNKIRFGRINFMNSDFGIQKMLHIVFCRNVMIYFDTQTKEKVLNRLCRYLVPDGYLFTGHSESLVGLNVPLKPVQPAVYRRVARPPVRDRH